MSPQIKSHANLILKDVLQEGSYRAFIAPNPVSEKNTFNTGGGERVQTRGHNFIVFDFFAG